MPGLREKVPRIHSTYGRVKVKTIQLFLGKDNHSTFSMEGPSLTDRHLYIKSKIILCCQPTRRSGCELGSGLLSGRLFNFIGRSAKFQRPLRKFSSASRATCPCNLFASASVVPVSAEPSLLELCRALPTLALCLKHSAKLRQFPGAMYVITRYCTLLHVTARYCTILHVIAD